MFENLFVPSIFERFEQTKERLPELRDGFIDADAEKLVIDFLENGFDVIHNIGDAETLEYAFELINNDTCVVCGEPCEFGTVERAYSEGRETVCAECQEEMDRNGEELK